MGAMKNHSMDIEDMKMLLVMNDISNARDEYREEMYRLRDENYELVQFLKIWSHDGTLQTFENREHFRARARALAAKVDGRRPYTRADYDAAPEDGTRYAKAEEA